MVMQAEHEGQPTRAPRRWGRWIGFTLLGLVVLLIAGHAFWGWWQDKKLQEEIAALRAKGEPMLIEELGNSPVPDEDNAVIPLREGARSIDKENQFWQEMDQMELGLPLNDKEMEAIGRVMAQNQ